ncbi:hypothetical protein HZS_4528 [Henneguya salminicola]|nr:hypothetical protein HZS_4528 [Henneguya salminicola]
MFATNIILQERRGIGGIFFDDLTGDDPLKLLDFMFECSICVIPSYIPILARTCYLPYTEKEVTWQKIRHGRYNYIFLFQICRI